MKTTFKMIKDLVKGDKVTIKMIVDNHDGYKCTVTSITVMVNFDRNHICYNVFDDFEVGCITSREPYDVIVELFEKTNDEGN